MNHIILQRKLSIPNSGKLLSRLDLIEKLNHHSQFPLTVIAAPAGYGKTSLVCNWLEYANHPVYWLSLDEQNNLPSSFWTYICHCLKRIDRDLDDKALSMLETHLIEDYCLITDLILASLEKLSRKWNRPSRAVIVLDDFQFIDNPLILKSFNRFLDYLPTWLQIVITARKPPALMLANRCSKSTAHVISATELIFNPEQIADFLKAKLNLRISKEQQQSLFQKTEGWAAAIQLTGLALKSGKSFEACTNTQNSLLAEFLFDEVFSQLNIEIQTLLIDISLVNHFNLDLCQAFNKKRDNEGIIESLINQGMFVSKVDLPINTKNSSHSYRLHSLFRQWIIDNNPAPIEKIHHNKTIALLWLTKNGNLHEALDLSIELENWQACSNLMEQLYPSLIQVTHFDHVSSILGRIPENIIRSLPHLCLLSALINFSQYEYDQVEKYTKYLEDHFESDSISPHYTKTKKTSLIMGSMILRSQVARFSGENIKAKNINHILETRYFKDGTSLNCWLMLGKGVDYFLDDEIINANQCSNTALTLAKTVEDGLCCIAALSWLLHGLYHNGKIHEAIALGEQNILWLQKMNFLSMPNISSVFAAMSVLYLESNKTIQAWDSYDKLLGTINDFTEPREIIYNKFHTHFHLLSSTGRYDEALTCLDRLENFEHQLGKDLGPDFSILLNTKTFRALLESKIGNHLPLLQLANDNESETERKVTNYRFRLLFENMIQAAANMIVSSGDNNSFSEIAKTSASTGNNHRQIACYLAHARILYSLGEEEKALDLFKTALETAQKYQFTNLLIEDQANIYPMIKGAINSGIEVEYCQFLITAIDQRKTNDFKKSSEQQDSIKNHQPSEISHRENKTYSESTDNNETNKYSLLNQDLIETLSHRELEVLSLINQGKRNKDIAESLSISLSTVKRHLQNTYQKLQVNSRTEAIAILNDRSSFNS
tara:strand:- start:8469 stop:11300 length:2832 start_codon:yes stop_codon:yes gene_type:complete